MLFATCVCGEDLLKTVETEKKEYDRYFCWECEIMFEDHGENGDGQIQLVQITTS